MTATFNLAVSAASDPFPFAAIAVCSYLKDQVNVNVSYDRGEPGCILTRADGTQVDDGESIVRALAKEAGIESNSTQVCMRGSSTGAFLIDQLSRERHSSLYPNHCHRRKTSTRWCPR